MRALVDTGPLVALLDRRDAWHAWARSAFDDVEAPLLTCEAVLSEACFLLARARHSPALVLDLVERGVIEPRFSLRGEGRHVKALLERYGDVLMSFADACLVRMAELAPGAALLTLDRDFLVYRLHRRRRLRLIAPFSA